MKKTESIAIVGGGPAGLSLARMLHDKGYIGVTVFEASDRPGGRCMSVLQEDRIIELGTAYMTFEHHRVRKWMRAFDMTFERLGGSSFDGTDFMTYIKQGAGAPFALQVLTYLRKRRAVLRGLKSRHADTQARALEAATLPIGEWLAQHKLHKIERFLHRILTVMGYGFTNQTSMFQAARWVSPSLIVTCVLKRLDAPVQGWEYFWRRLSETLDVNTSSPVTRVQRGASAVTITTPDGDRVFDHCVCAMPVDDWAKIVTEPTAAERAVAAGVEWQGYTSNLVAVDDWFMDSHTMGYSAACAPGSPYGRICAARREVDEAELGGRIYAVGQLPGDLSKPELNEILIEEIQRRGGTNPRILISHIWRYFPMWTHSAIAGGLIDTLDTMQGQQRTWYTGATFSFEAISHIVNFNHDLLGRIAAQPSDDAKSAIAPTSMTAAKAEA